MKEVFMRLIEIHTMAFYILLMTVQRRFCMMIKHNSTWSINGTCIDGTMKGDRLQTVQAYQEFWHSWEAFHPQYRNL